MTIPMLAGYVSVLVFALLLLVGIPRWVIR